MPATLIVTVRETSVVQLPTQTTRCALVVGEYRSTVATWVPLTKIPALPRSGPVRATQAMWRPVKTNEARAPAALDRFAAPPQ